MKSNAKVGKSGHLMRARRPARDHDPFGAFDQSGWCTVTPHHATRTSRLWAESDHQRVDNDILRADDVSLRGQTTCIRPHDQELKNMRLHSPYSGFYSRSLLEAVETICMSSTSDFTKYFALPRGVIAMELCRISTCIGLAVFSILGDDET